MQSEGRIIIRNILITTIIIAIILIIIVVVVVVVGLVFGAEQTIAKVEYHPVLILRPSQRTYFNLDDA